MKEEEIVNWIDNYRKWRQWNRQHKLMAKGLSGGASHGEILEDDLTSPYCSPLFSVVAFAKSSKILNPDQMRRVLINHQLKAAYRVVGLKYHERLQALLG